MPFSTSPFFEVQGLAPCPIQRKHKCAEPEAWHAIYHLTSEQEARETLAHVTDSTAGMYDRYEDFRICPPIAKRLERFKAHVGYPWERDAPPKRRRSPQPSTPSNVVAIKDAKSLKAKKKDKKRKKRAKVK